MWDQAAIDRLTKLWNDGLSGAKIMEDLNDFFHRGFTRNSIIGKARRLGLAKREGPSNIPTGPRTAWGKPGPKAYLTPEQKREHRAALVRAHYARAKERLAALPKVPKQPRSASRPKPGELLERMNGPRKGRMTLDEVQAAKACLFPFGHRPTMLYCGGKRAPGRSYCAECCEVAYQPTVRQLQGGLAS